MQIIHPLIILIVFKKSNEKWWQIYIDAISSSNKWHSYESWSSRTSVKRVHLHFPVIGRTSTNCFLFRVCAVHSQKRESRDPCSCTRVRWSHTSRWVWSNTSEHITNYLQEKWNQSSPQIVLNSDFKIDLDLLICWRHRFLHHIPKGLIWGC